jgi:hypothetical protein
LSAGRPLVWDSKCRNVTACVACGSFSRKSGMYLMTGVSGSMLINQLSDTERGE